MSQKKFCPWCGRGTVGCPAFGNCISEQEKSSLAKFVAENGRNWRGILRVEWGNGSSLLRQVRNIVGPSQLSKVNPRQFEAPYFESAKYLTNLQMSGRR